VGLGFINLDLCFVGGDNGVAETCLRFYILAFGIVFRRICVLLPELFILFEQIILGE
jgi:hypothetical protein